MHFFKYGSMLYHVLLCNIFSIVFGNVVKLPTESIIKDMTLNFFLNLQNHNFRNTNSSDFKSQTLDDITTFQKSIIRNLRDIKEQYQQPSNHAPNLQRMIEADVYPFKQFEEYGILKTQEIKDIAIFSHKYVNTYDEKNSWFAGIVTENTDDSTLTIYKFMPKENNWKFLQSENLVKSSSLRTLSTIDGTLLILAHSANYNKLNDGISVFLLNDNNRFIHVQDLDINNFSNVALWKCSENIFLMPTIEHVDHDGEIKFETNNPLYIWKGNHFDILNYIPTKNVKKIIPFQIGTTYFIGIANHKNDYGEKNIFSEIFKYEPQRNEFISLQKLATNGAIDINFFGFQWSTFMDAFIIIINKYDTSNKEFYSTSVLYKYDKGYFIPFQNIPCHDVVKWLPITGNNGEFLLLGISNYNDIKIFQYNGWNFIEVYHKFNILKNFEGITKVNVFVFYDNPILTITNNIHGESTNYFYKPIFGSKNPIGEIKNKINSWCEKILVTLSCFGTKYYNTHGSFKNIIENLKHHEAFNSSVNNKNTSITLIAATVDKLETKAIYSDDFEFNHNIIQNINDVSSSLYSQLSSIASLHEILSLTMLNNLTIRSNSMKIENLHLSCFSGPCNLKNVKLSKINMKDFDYYQKEIVYVENGFQNFKDIIIDNLIVKYKLFVQLINDKLLDNIRKLIHMIVENNGITVEGTLFLNNGISLSGRLSNMKLNDEVILLKEGNQHLKGQLFISKLKSTILEVPQINDIVLKDFQNSINSVNKTLPSTNLRKLTVNDIFVDKMNSIQKILSHALKLNGDQILRGRSNIDHLGSKQVLFNDNEFKDFFLRNFIKISSGHFQIDQDLHLKSFGAKNLFITGRLNNVPIIEDKMDVLLLNSKTEQKLIGEKIFENVELMGPVNLVGRINRGSLEKKNPITMIEEPLILTGDFIILGNVSIDARIKCDNLINDVKGLSLKHLQQRGLKLSDDLINIPITFTQPLEVINIDSDIVNGIDPSSWLVSQSDNIKMVTGKKIFIHDLEIRGNCSIPIHINEQKSSSFANILNVNTNQEITGKIFIANLTTKGLNCNNATFGGKHYGKILNTERNHSIINEIIANNVAIIHQNIFSETSDIFGKINNWNIHYLINDTIFMDKNVIDFGSSLSLKDLEIINLIKLTRISHMDIKDIESWMNWEREIYFSGPLYIENPLNVQRSVFGLSISGISKADFGYSWLLSTDDQIIHGKLNFNAISCSNALYIESRIVNDLDIIYLYENAVWLNEDSYLRNVNYAKDPVIKQYLNLNGYINYIKRPNDFILRESYPDWTIYISGYKILQKSIFVDQKILPTLVCTIPLNNFCALMTANDEYFIPSMVLEGNLIMKKEPFVFSLNNTPMEIWSNSIWFSDTIFNTKMNNIFNNVIFKSYVILEGLMNQFDLYSLQNNYISTSTNQDIDNLFNIHNISADIVIVEDETITDEGGGDIENIYFNTLNVNELQTFTKNLKFHTVKGNVYLYDKVNDLDVSTDIMRISLNPNIVYGNKRFMQDLSVKNIFTKYLQGVEINMWNENSAMIQEISSYSFIDVKTLHMASVKNLNILGYVNDKSTNYLLNTEEMQIITGKVSFGEDDIFFNNCIIEQNINGINIKEMFDNMILNTSKSAIFTRPKTLASSILLENISINGNFNDSNFEKTISAISQRELYNNYRDEFKYMSNHITNLAQNYYANCAKIIFDIELLQLIKGDIKMIKTLRNVMGINTYISIVIENSNGYHEIHFFRWNVQQHKFINDKSIPSLFLNADFSELFVIKLINNTLLYVETLILENDAEEYRGSIYKWNERDGYVKIQEIPTNKTNSVIDINVDQDLCITLIKSNDNASIYCLDEDLNSVQPRGILSIQSDSEVFTMKLPEALYLIAQKPNQIDIHHWLQNDNQKLSLVQSLPFAICFAFITWKNLHILALASSEKIIVYRFDSNVQRFIEIQTILQPPGVQSIHLNKIDDSQMVLTVIIIEQGKSSQIFLYKYDGLAMFQLQLIHNIPNSEIKTVSVMTEINAYIVALASSNGVTIYRSKLKD